jgi:hypothetical protein
MVRTRTLQAWACLNLFFVGPGGRSLFASLAGPRRHANLTRLHRASTKLPSLSARVGARVGRTPLKPDVWWVCNETEYPCLSSGARLGLRA